MKGKLKPAFLIASLTLSAGLLGCNLVSTFAVQTAEATNVTDSELFEFDQTEEDSSASDSEEDSETEDKTTSIEVTFDSYNDVDYCLVKANLAYLSDLRTWLAEDSSGNVGVNIKQDFSDLIEDAEGDVILAIDGDFPFWSTTRKGYVIRNGVNYRSTCRTDDEDDLAIFKDGSYMIYNESDYDFDTIMNMNGGCWQNWSFGPALVKNGKVAVDEDEEISGKSMSANQRTAMGITEDGEFYFIASAVDGSRQKGTGLSLYEVANLLLDKGCDVAYNFDGGGSSALYYKVDGKGYYFNEGRDLGDIVYVVA